MKKNIHLSPSLHSHTWLSNLACGGSLYRIFEDMQDILFFAKDLEFRNRACNQDMLDHLGLQTSDQLHGMQDKDFLPPYMINQYRLDDESIIKSKAPLLKIVELFPAENGLPQLYITNKYPLFDAENQVCGICGILRKLNEKNYTHMAYSELGSAVEYITQNYSNKISIQVLASKSNLSVRQFQRRFQQTFRLTPSEYIVKYRLLKAADQLINSNESVTDIALKNGFYDHSSFSKHFKKKMNLPPLKYRSHFNIPPKI